MYQNNLNNFIDAMRRPNSFKCAPDVNKTPTSLARAMRLNQLVANMAPNAICFYSDAELVPDIDCVAEITRIPYKVCWFEFRWSDNNQIESAFCYENDCGFELAHYVRPPSSCANQWVFAGYYCVSPQPNGMIQIEEIFGLEGDGGRNFIKAVLRYLQALNCCNIKRTEHKPTPSQQSVRRALGRQPLFSTWTLEIDLQRTNQEMPGQGGTHASPRLHLRRGHARQYRPGKWCWVQPHVVGDKSLGMIHKDYAAH